MKALLFFVVGYVWLFWELLNAPDESGSVLFDETGGIQKYLWSPSVDGWQ